MSFETYLSNLPHVENYKETTKQLTKIIKGEYLLYSDIENNPEKFFDCHREFAVNKQHSLGIKFTVQYNLFGGTIMFLGNDKQRKFLFDSQKNGILGCFALTEKSAGVMSGFVVNTEAKYIPESNSFLLNSIDREHSKTWISQGLSAQYSVVIANLVINNTNKGPHAFLIQMDLEGIQIKDMGLKTDLNALDNAEIYFDNVRIDYDCLLSRFTSIVNNEYKLDGLNKYSFITIAQKLLTGRFCIGDSMITYFNKLIGEVETNLLQREIYLTNDNKMKLAELPHIRDKLIDVKKNVSEIIKFNNYVRSRLVNYMKTKQPVPADLIELISITKIASTEISTNESLHFRQLVGSQALMKSSGLGSNLDVMYCSQFAEGDNKILKQKITRDWLSSIKKNPRKFFKVPSFWGKIYMLMLLIKMWFNPSIKTWMENYKTINSFADIIVNNEIKKTRSNL